MMITRDMVAGLGSTGVFDDTVCWSTVRTQLLAGHRHIARDEAVVLESLDAFIVVFCGSLAGYLEGFIIVSDLLVSYFFPSNHASGNLEQLWKYLT